MPYVPVGCIQRGCAGTAVHRGYCETHRRSEEQRGYGREWHHIRGRVREQERACRECGTTVDLTVDHIVPQSMGGTNDRDNLRVLCRSCHARIGTASTRAGIRTSTYSAYVVLPTQHPGPVKTLPATDAESPPQRLGRER